MSAISEENDCLRTQLLPIENRGNTVYLVRYFNQSCAEFDYSESHPFCGDSGWEDEEASVVCRSEKNSTYGIGSKSTGLTFVGQWKLHPKYWLGVYLEFLTQVM